MKNKKKSLILVILFFVFVLGIGYAYLTTTLSINGTTDVDSNVWNVYWDNVQVSDGSVTGDQVTMIPTIDTDKTAVSFQVRLSKPGDYYEFTVEAKNDGTIDAMIDTITKTTSIPNYLNYIVTYDDDIDIEEKHLLSSNKKEKYKIRLEYRTDIDPDDLPSTADSVSLMLYVTYIQADSTAFVRNHYVYTDTISDTFVFRRGNEILEGGTIYYDYNDLVSNNSTYFLKIKIENNVITDEYAGIVYNNRVYFLKGGVDERVLTDKPVFENNKKILNDIYGEENCTESLVDSTIIKYDCRYNTSTVMGMITSDGLVNVGRVAASCFVRGDGYARCQEGELW